MLFATKTFTTLHRINSVSKRTLTILIMTKKYILILTVEV